ncbi:Catalase [Salmonella enterica subsp. enterica serovar Rubislaw str. A4-653]|uniref:catalase n=1 Tax=Salmonella enterica subsp. enterica serovar Rubislaw str. A4-653 TaxID=913081 RepID=G5QHC9_SALRU|nr:Catalase [Salmonella enterica subsp. enterica serovar Rubislaw str. A4-653]
MNHSPAWTPWRRQTVHIAPRQNRRRRARRPARWDGTPPGAQPTAPGSLKAPETANDKLTALDNFRKGSENHALTTNQGVRIDDDQNSLRAGSRGPTLLEDFILREKITHFDHERIPERIVHARGSAAHGYFQPYKDLSDITKAAFLCDPRSTENYPGLSVRSTENYPGLCSLFDSTGRRGVC